MTLDFADQWTYICFTFTLSSTAFPISLFSQDQVNTTKNVRRLAAGSNTCDRKEGENTIPSVAKLYGIVQHHSKIKSIRSRIYMYMHYVVTRQRQASCVIAFESLTTTQQQKDAKFQCGPSYHKYSLPPTQRTLMLMHSLRRSLDRYNIVCEAWGT